MRVGRLFLNYCSASNFNPKKSLLWSGGNENVLLLLLFSQTNHSGTVLSELLT